MKRYSKILSDPYINRILLFAVALWMMACTPSGNSGSGDVLVRVYDKYLYASDLEGVVPEGASARDSLTAVRNYIQNWVDRELVVRKAEENLPEEAKDFSVRIEEYRNSLIIFEYEKMLISQELDTNVSMEAINDYYERMKGNFTLKEDIIDLQYLKIHSDSPAIRKFRQFMSSDVPDDQDSLALYSSRYATTFSLIEDHWLNLEEMHRLLPIDAYSYNDFLSRHRFLEITDSVFIFMVNVRNYKPADSLPPVNFIEGDIRKIIINKRKNDLIKNMRQTVLQDALERNQVEIF